MNKLGFINLGSTLPWRMASPESRGFHRQACAGLHRNTEHRRGFALLPEQIQTHEVPVFPFWVGGFPLKSVTAPFFVPWPLGRSAGNLKHVVLASGFPVAWRRISCKTGNLTRFERWPLHGNQTDVFFRTLFLVGEEGQCPTEKRRHETNG